MLPLFFMQSQDHFKVSHVFRVKFKHQWTKEASWETPELIYSLNVSQQLFLPSTEIDVPNSKKLNPRVKEGLEISKKLH